MTTKLIIENDGTSNGDVVVRWANVCFVTDPNRDGNGTNNLRLHPGDKPVEIGITDFSLVSIHEERPE